MIQVIGLMIAVYAIVRMVQIPFEICPFGGPFEWRGMPFIVRFFIVTGVSIFGVVILTILTLLLLSIRT